MEKNEKTEFILKAKSYLQEKKITDLLESLMKQLLLKRPENPLDFLIEQLSGPRNLRLLFCYGILESHSQEISSSIATEFNFKYISLENLLQEEIKKNPKVSKYIQESLKELAPLNDDMVNEIVLREINSVEPKYRGVLINGYPRTLQQALFMQEKGVIPEKYFIFEFQENIILKEFESKVFQQKQNDLPRNKILEKAKLLTKVSLLNIEDLKRVYDNLYTLINCSDKTKETVISLLKGIIYPRAKKKFPLRPPCILIIRPQAIKKAAQKISAQLAETFDLVNISISQLLQEEIDKKSEIGNFAVEKFSQKEEIPDDIIGSLMRTALLKSNSRHKGWVLEGYPKNIIQFRKFISLEINPHLVIILDEKEESLKMKYGKIVIDPETNKSYEAYELGQDFDSEILKKMIPNQKYAANNAFNYIEEHKDLIKKIYEHYQGKFFIYKLDSINFNDIIKETKEHLNDSKIYN